MTKTVNAFNLSLLQARYPKPSYPICEKYKKYNCPHGQHGLTEVDEEQCRYLHPKRCFKYTKAGNHSVHGCTKGNECEFYHPILCKYSVRYRRCLNPECTYTHLRFTKRNNRDRPEPGRQKFEPWASDEDYRSPPNANIPRESSNVGQKQYSKTPTPWKEKDPATSEATEHNNSPPKVDQPDITFLVKLVSSMSTDMQNFNRSITDQVKSLQPVKQQMESIHQEMTEMRNIRRQLEQAAQLQQAAQLSHQQQAAQFMHQQQHHSGVQASHNLQVTEVHPGMQANYNLHPLPVR